MNSPSLALLGFLCTTTITTNVAAQQAMGYGVDVSFPMHYSQLSDGNRQNFYDNFMEGCREYYGNRGEECAKTEVDRIAMNLRQPQSMQNYTELGFKKVKAPKKIYNMIKKFWDDNHGEEDPEEWFTGNTYTNHWEAPTMILAVDDDTLTGGGKELKNMIWDAARSEIQQWTGEELSPVSLYGIRKYTTGAVLATHVDRLPLVSSAIINVAQDVDEPWPLELIGHDGKAYNVTMEPGEMVLYESHSVLHGRPFPLKGRFYANVFIHFEPVGHSLRHGHNPALDNHQDFISGHENSPNHGLPPYVLEGSPEAALWRQKHPEQWEPGYYEADPDLENGANGAHYAATIGDHLTMRHIVDLHRREMLHEYDVNGWLPLHEAARRGHVEVLKVLVEEGADVNDRTWFGDGHSALNLAYQSLEEDHPMIAYLLTLGAEDIAPEPDL